ncbi:MAG: formyltransferase family protein [bacterium]|nr:formyltransferase family protein [bacterium]
MRPKIVVFASGTKNGGPSPRQSGLRPREGGGSGFENLVGSKGLDADIVAVVSNHEHGGVRERAERLGVPFIFFGPNSDYRKIVADSGAEWVALSGWFKFISGLDPRKTFNIHPALLSQLGGRFGGKGMYGRHIHEAVKKAFDAGEIIESGFTMHFVTDEMDRGPAFFEHHVPLKVGMSAEEIGKAIQAAEHEWQPKITNMVVHGEIRWDGKDPKSLVIPEKISV